MRTYTLIWIGQTASLIGSEITRFALLIWIWQLTDAATPISLLAFSSEISVLVASVFAGVLVDRFNRKGLMMLGDTIAGCCTIAILILFLTGHLAIWHLYVAGAVGGLFGYIQGLAFSASQALIVPKQHYVRIGAMGSIQGFGSGVFAPALAGALYPIVGLSGILAFDLITFAIAVTILAIVSIPQPISSPSTPRSADAHGENPLPLIPSLWHDLTLGFRYLWQHPSLKALQLFALSYIFFDNAALLEPVVLARTDSDTAVLGSVLSALGLGGLIGAIALGIWGGPRRRIRGVLWGRAIIFSFEMLLGLAHAPIVWVTAFFCAGLIKPTANSCEDAIWLAKVPPTAQGRVFAASSFLISVFSPIGLLISGPLSDQVFEPAMRPGGILAPLLGNIFGTDPGSGMALQFAFFSLVVVLICLVSYAIPALREVDDRLPDHDDSSR
jgi:MFS transporter, DHA3 family, macrolide efflux protein